MLDTYINRTATAAAINAIDLKFAHRDLLRENMIMRTRIIDGVTAEEIPLLLADLDRQAQTIAQVEQESRDSLAVADMADEVACVTAWTRHAETRGIAGILNPNKWIAEWKADRQRKRAERMAKYEARKSRNQTSPDAA